MTPQTPQPEPIFKPMRLRAHNAAMYGDQSVAGSYQHRAPYPPETFDLLRRLITDAPRVVLDVGCGTGFIARPLAPLVDRVDALDMSAAMVAAGRSLPGGEHPHLRWLLGRAEDAPLDPPYALIVAASSFHWLEWHVTLPRFARALTPHGLLAIVTPNARGGPRFSELISRYSHNRDFAVDDMYDWRAELERRDLFVPMGEADTAYVPFEQSFDDYIDGWHSMGGFSRERMGAGAVAAFDRELRAVLEATYPDGVVRAEIGANLHWGKPAGG